MPYTSKQASGSRTVGLVVVALLHIGLVYALVNGLARKAIEVVRGPLETQVIEEKQPDTPPPPPPPPPKFDVPPPPFVPPVEVQVETPPPPPVVATVTTARPAVVEPPRAAPTHVAPPAPPRGARINAKSFTPPDYPAASIRLGEEGSVVIDIFCDPDGHITDAKVAKSSGYDRLDEATVREAKRGRWTCTPAERDGKPVGSWGGVKYTFRLQDAR